LIRKTLPSIGLPVLPPRREPVKTETTGQPRPPFNKRGGRRPEKKFVPRRRSW